jgi:hypothetical protein
MEDTDIVHSRNLFQTKTKLLQALELQAAQKGIETPAHITVEIEDLRREIEQLQKLLEVEGAKQGKSFIIISTYREPLLRSAHDLQSRIFNIVEQGFLQVYYRDSEEDRDYALKSTLFVIADFFGWKEILRREARFLDLGTVEASRRLEELLSTIEQLFSTDGIDLTFRVFRIQQRAIGEIMICDRSSIEAPLETMGYAQFIKSLENPDFSHWFSKIQKDVESLSNELWMEHVERLIRVQHALIDLINFLDPRFTRIPDKYRGKIADISID